MTNNTIHQTKQPYYLTFTKDHDMADALKVFIGKFSTHPAEVFIERDVLWLGPVLEKSNG